MRSYENLNRFFKNLSMDIRDKSVAIHGKAILKLLPRIKADQTFSALVIGAAHATLYMIYDQGQHSILIWGESENTYRVSIYHEDSLQESDSILVDDTDVIRVLEEYVAKLSPTEKF